MKMRVCVASVLALLIWGATSQAKVLIDATFSGDRSGEEPSVQSTATPGATTTKPQYVRPGKSKASADQHAWVRSKGYSSVGDGTVLELWDDVAKGDDTQVSVRFTLNKADDVSSNSENKVVTISWDMLRARQTQSGGNIFLNLRTSANGESIETLVFRAAKDSCKFMVGGTDEYQDAANKNHSYKIELNYATSELKFWIDGVLQSTFNFDSNKPFASVDLTTATTGRCIVALDNFKIETSTP